MKLLFFSDIHCDVAASERLVEQSQGVDVVVGAGDFCTMRRGIDTTIDALKAIECPTVLVPGNNESRDELVEACQAWPHANVLHGSGLTVNGINFYGLGGGVPVTPFGAWSCDFTEGEAADLLAGCPPGCLLISHSPPKGAVDVSATGQSLGSVAVRETIDRLQPSLVVCGHIHESAGQGAQLGTTVVLNVGPRGLVWEIPDAVAA